MWTISPMTWGLSLNSHCLTQCSINICWSKEGNECWKGEIRKEERRPDIRACNYDSERLNMQISNSQAICDNRILTQKPRKPNHNLCHDVLRAIRTWSTAVKFHIFAPIFNSEKQKPKNPRKLSVGFLPCQWHPIRTYSEPSSFFPIVLSHSLPAFASLPNLVMVADSPAIVITEEIASICSHVVGLLKFP